MLSFLPLAVYLLALGCVTLVMRGLGPARRHVLFWIFIAYSAAYALRFAALAAFPLPFSSLETLSDGEFIGTTLLLNLLLVAAAVVYRLGYTWAHAARARQEAHALAWERFTAQWGDDIYRQLKLVAIAAVGLALFVRFVVQGDRFLLGFAADVESRQASMGWGVVPFLLTQILITVVFVAVELRRPPRDLAALLLGLIILAGSSGSKGALLVPFIYIITYALHRRRLLLTAARVQLIALVAFGSLTAGVFVRARIESGSWRPEVLLSPFRVLVPALARFFAFDLAQIMVAQPSRYLGLIDEFRSYFFAGVVPAAFWPGKPLNPCLRLADSLGFPFVSCVAPGWIGGALILVGPLGLAAAPLVVGLLTARFSRAAVVREQAISLRQPLLFSSGILWLGLVNEGVYYQFLPVYLPLFAMVFLVYLWIVLWSGRLGMLPLMRTR